MNYTWLVFWQSKSDFGYVVDHSFRTTEDAVRRHMSSLLGKENVFGLGCRKI